jgi:nitrogen fixation/metabolism regulation signal transduction histidine kinase
VREGSERGLIDPEQTLSQTIDMSMIRPQKTSKIRRMMLLAVSLGVGFSVIGSVAALIRLADVNHAIQSINRTYVPFSKQLTQIRSDVKLYRREILSGALEDRRPERPQWLSELISSQIAQARQRLERAQKAGADSPWLAKWKPWLQGFQARFKNVDHDLEIGRVGRVDTVRTPLGGLVREVDWATAEVGKDVSFRFQELETHFDRLRAGLQLLLLIVGVLSLFLLWFSERALRPLAALTRLVREIAEDGLKKHHKSDFGSVRRTDEVGQLEREFRRMATVIFEREKTVSTQKHRMEEQNRLLRELANLNENVLSSMVAFVWVFDPDGKVTHCNPAAAKWLKVNPGSVRGQAWENYPALAQFLTSGDRIWTRSKDEEVSLGEFSVAGRKLEGRLIPLRDRVSRTTVGRILIVDDRTDQHELEKKLQWAEHMAAVGRLSAQVAHEVRNPLHSIGLEAELGLDSLDKVKDEELGTARESFRGILSGVERVERITQNYLQLTRVSARKWKRVSLDLIIQETLATYATELEELQVSVDWKTAAGLKPVVWVDSLLMEQALGNLVKNAMEAMQDVDPTDRRLRLTIDQLESGRLLLKVEDTGTGIDDEAFSRLFEPYSTTKAQGSGLGLSFVRQVMHEFDGEIKAVRRARGACFEIVLPSAPVQEARSEEPKEGPHA